MKKVLNILPSGDFGGIERICLELAKRSENENHFYFMWHGGRIADEIASYTDNVVVRKFLYRKIFSEYVYFRNYIKNNKIDVIVVHVPSPIFLLYLSWITTSTTDIKIVVYIHSDPIDIFDIKIKLWQFKHFIRKVYGIISVSEYVSRKMIHTFNINSVETIYNGIDINNFSVVNAYEELDYVNLIYVGRLIPEKGTDLLIKCLKDATYKYRLSIVGDGPCRHELEALSKQLGLTDYICFMGSRDDIPELLSRADIFVHPATLQEGFGLTIVEAMAAGVPCVAFSRGAIPEIITDNVDGFLVDEVSHVALANKLEQIVKLYNNDRTRYEMISENAQKRAEYFSIDKYIENLDGYMDSM